MAKKKAAAYREYEAELDRRIAQGDYPRTALICGEQDLLRSQNARRLRDAILGSGDPMNSTLLRGSAVTASQIIDLAETMPFFSERRVITVEETIFFSRAGGEAEMLAAYLERIPETTSIIFIDPAPNTSYKLYKTIARLGFILRCDTPDEAFLRSWAAGRFEEAGMAIDGRAMALFLEDAGTDMLKIRSESDKLIGYCLGKSRITEDDVRAVCVTPVKDRIFDMISAVSKGNRPEAMSIYMDLRRLQTSPQAILTLLIRQYTQLLQAGELLQTMGDKEAAAALGINPWVFSNRLRPTLRGCSRIGLENALEACVRADEQYKNGKIAPDIAVEELIVKLSGGKIR